METQNCNKKKKKEKKKKEERKGKKKKNPYPKIWKISENGKIIVSNRVISVRSS